MTEPPRGEGEPPKMTRAKVTFELESEEECWGFQGVIQKSFQYVTKKPEDAVAYAFGDAVESSGMSPALLAARVVMDVISIESSEEDSPEHRLWMAAQDMATAEKP